MARLQILTLLLTLSLVSTNSATTCSQELKHDGSDTLVVLPSTAILGDTCLVGLTGNAWARLMDKRKELSTCTDQVTALNGMSAACTANSVLADSAIIYRNRIITKQQEIDALQTSVASKLDSVSAKKDTLLAKTKTEDYIVLGLASAAALLVGVILGFLGGK